MYADNYKQEQGATWRQKVSFGNSIFHTAWKDTANYLHLRHKIIINIFEYLSVNLW